MVRAYRLAAILILVQGVALELGGVVSLIPLLVSGAGQDELGPNFTFIVDYLQDNLFLMMAVSVIFGIVRVIGAVGLLRNRMWGWVLSVITCSISLSLMILVLPSGIADGILSGGALVLLLTRYFGDRPIGQASALVPQAHAVLRDEDSTGHSIRNT